MQHLKKSLGSLAAVAALAPTQQATAAIVFSTFSNVPAVGNIDIDGNGVDDFSLNSSGGLFGLLGPNATAVDLSSDPIFFIPDSSSVNGSFNFESFPDISPVIGDGSTYLGVRFDRGGDTHYGYLAFDIPTTFNTGTLLGGGWQSTPLDGASVKPVPEPATFTLLAGGLTLMTASRRRRKPS